MSVFSGLNNPIKNTLNTVVFRPASVSSPTHDFFVCSQVATPPETPATAAPAPCTAPATAVTPYPPMAALCKVAKALPAATLDPILPAAADPIRQPKSREQSAT